MQRTDIVDYRRVINTLGVSVALMGFGLTWAFIGMRAALAVGGSCADGGPYVSVQPCPQGALMIMPGIPIALIAAFWGTSVTQGLSAPPLLLPMWALTFLALGSNFWAKGLGGDESGPTGVWIILGVLFWAIGAPAVVLAVKGSTDYELSWWTRYAGLAAVGVLLGLLTFSVIVS